MSQKTPKEMLAWIENAERQGAMCRWSSAEKSFTDAIVVIGMVCGITTIIMSIPVALYLFFS